MKTLVIKLIRIFLWQGNKIQKIILQQNLVKRRHFVVAGIGDDGYEKTGFLPHKFSKNIVNRAKNHKKN